MSAAIFWERGYLVVCGMRLLGSVEIALQVMDMSLGLSAAARPLRLDKPGLTKGFRAI